MSYDKKKVKIYDPKTWYDILYHKYHDFHKDLDSWDKWMFMKFLPENLNWLNILDIGAWDWRLLKYFKWKNYSRYVCCDISEKIMKRIRGNVEKIVCDLEWELPFVDQEFDIVLSFFVLLHIENIQWLFEEIYRVLKPWAKFIALHHIEHRPYEYNMWGEKFKIRNFIHKYEYIEKAADYSFFDIDYMDLLVGNNIVGKVYCFTKK